MFKDICYMFFLRGNNVYGYNTSCALITEKCLPTHCMQTSCITCWGDPIHIITLCLLYYKPVTRVQVQKSRRLHTAAMEQNCRLCAWFNSPNYKWKWRQIKELIFFAISVNSTWGKCMLFHLKNRTSTRHAFKPLYRERNFTSTGQYSWTIPFTFIEPF